MEKLFNNILLPVRFNRQSEIAVEKAVHFANQLQCNLHLLHVIPETALQTFRKSLCDFLGIRITHTAIKQQVYKLQNKFAGQLKKGQLLFISLEKGDLVEIISHYIESHEIDLLLAGRDLHYIPYENTVQNIHYSTLTMTPKLEMETIKTIVLPVGKNLDLNKLRIAAYLAREFEATIHLVAIETNEDYRNDLPYMKKAFRILKDNTDIPVICTTLDGHDAGEALKKYGKKVNADLIITNSQVLNIWRRLHRRLFHKSIRDDGLPILAVD